MKTDFSHLRTSIATLAAAATAVCLFAAPPSAHAQRTKPLQKAKTGAAPKIAPGVLALPGETLQVGTMYMTGTGDNRINVRVDKVELAEQYNFIFAGNKKTNKIADPTKTIYLVVRMTVQNLSSKPRPIFNSDVGGKDDEPFLQVGFVRQYKNEYDGTPQTEYKEMSSQEFRRDGDGLTLRLEGPGQRYNILQPGQTMHAFLACEVLRNENPLISQLQINYFNSPVSEEQGIGKDVRGRARPSLMTFDLKGMAATAPVAAPLVTTGNAGGIPWGDDKTAGRIAEVGKTYRIGSGDKMLDITVTKMQALDMPEGASEFGGEKRQAKVLLVYLSAHNPTKKPLLAFSMPNGESPWIQPSLWRNNSGGGMDGERADYFFTPDGKTDLTYVKDRDMSVKNPAIVQPGKTAQAVVRVEFTDSPSRYPLALFRLNYSSAFHAALDLTSESRQSKSEDAQAVAQTLLTYPLDKILPNATPLSEKK